MTKTLTEQWREGKLPEGLYYIEGKGNHDIALIRNRYCPVLTSPYDEDNFFESEFVPVEPVPSYEEYQDLIQQNVNQESAIETYIERIKELEEMFDSAVVALYEYIKMHGIERECSKFLEKYAERAK